MINSVDKLLLSSAQQAELEQYTRAYSEAAAAGDQAAMQDAHRRAEALRASAGYSGGASGDRYELLRSANAPSGYAGYEALVNNYAGGGMHAIAAGYEDQLSKLDQQRAEIEAQGKKDQAAARSAAWNVQRLASEGLLTRGLENTGIADTITAAALNQAAANAYQALLETRQELNENTSARASARADALSEAAELQSDIGNLLGEVYSDFYQMDADQRRQLLLKQLDKDAAEQKQQRDYYYTLALQQLKRQWELEDQAKGL